MGAGTHPKFSTDKCEECWGHGYRPASGKWKIIELMIENKIRELIVSPMELYLGIETTNKVMTNSKDHL